MSWSRTFGKEELRRMVKMSHKSSSLLNPHEDSTTQIEEHRIPKLKNNKSSRYDEQSGISVSKASKFSFPESLDSYPLEMQIKYALRPITNPGQKVENLKKQAQEEEQLLRQEEEEGTKNKLSLPPVNISAASTSQRSTLSHRYSDLTADVSKRYSSMLTGSRNDSIIWDPRKSGKSSPIQRSQPTLITAPKLDSALLRKNGRKNSYKKAASLFSYDIHGKLQQLRDSLNINLADIQPKKNITGKVHESADALDSVKEAKLIISTPRSSSSDKEAEIPLDNLDGQGMQKLLKQFTNLNQDTRKDRQSKHTPQQKYTQSVERNAILNDFRPKKAPKHKEYYNRYYIPVESWSIERLRDPPLRKRDLMLKDELYVFKNLHNHDRAEEKNPFEKVRKKNEYEQRYELVQERLRQNPIAGVLKAELLKKRKRIPEFLKHVSVPNDQKKEPRKNLNTDVSKHKASSHSKETEQDNQITESGPK